MFTGKGMGLTAVEKMKRYNARKKVGERCYTFSSPPALIENYLAQYNAAGAYPAYLGDNSAFSRAIQDLIKYATKENIP